MALSNPRRFVRRAQNEVLVPSGRLAGAARELYCRLVPNRSPLSRGNPDRLLLVYDSLCNPVTFDFLHYIYYADWLRGELGKAHLDVMLVIRKNVSASREEHYMAAIGADNIDWRVANIIMPLCRQFAPAGRVYVLDHEEAFEVVKGYRHVHPQGYGYASPKSAECRLDAPGMRFRPTLIPSETARSVIDAYFPAEDARRLVTVTLRSYAYLAKRNSNIAAWAQFAHDLDPLKYRTVFIPDASPRGVATLEELAGCEVFAPACWNLELRTAIYERAWMNMGVAGGPLAISGILENAITVMIYDPASFPADYLDSFYRTTGVVPGEGPAFYSPRCRFYHGSDNTETIRKAFDEYAS